MNEVQNNNGAALANFNPFEKQNPLAHRGVNAGTVMVEQERAIAEVKGKLSVAKMFPRDEAGAFQRVMDACSRRSLAEVAEYSFKRGGQVVSGPTIRLAEVIAAAWGNIDYGMRELSRGEGYSEMEAYAWDMQTNTISAQRFTVNHIRDRSDANGGNAKLTAERDIYELTANNASRRMRERIFAVIPADLVDLAVRKCRETMAGNSERPIADRVRDVISRFNKYGVTGPMIEAFLGKKFDAVLPDDLASLTSVYNSLKEGAKASEFFGSDAPSLAGPPGQDQTGQDQQDQPSQQGSRATGKTTRVRAQPKADAAQAAAIIPPGDQATAGSVETGAAKEDAKAPALTPPAAANAAAEANGGGLGEVF